MRKAYLYLIILIFFANSSEAQSVKVSGELGLNVSNLTLVTQQIGYKSRSRLKELYSFKYGIRLEVAGSKRSSFETGLYYLKNGGILAKRYNFIEYTHLNYFQVPFDFKHKLLFGKYKESFYFTTGFYLGYLKKGVMTYNGLEYIIHKGYYKQVKRFDCGFSAGIGYQIPIGVYFRGNLSKSIININSFDFNGKIGDGKIFNNPVWSLTMGYQF